MGGKRIKVAKVLNPSAPFFPALQQLLIVAIEDLGKFPGVPLSQSAFQGVGVLENLAFDVEVVDCRQRLERGRNETLIRLIRAIFFWRNSSSLRVLRSIAWPRISASRSVASARLYRASVQSLRILRSDWGDFLEWRHSFGLTSRPGMIC